MLLNAVVVGIVMLLSASGNARILSLFGMSVGTSVAVINYISRIFAPIESLGMEIQTIQSAMAGVRRIDAFLAQPERAVPKRNETAARGDVALSHVTFGYGEKPVLRDFSMTITQNVDDLLQSHTARTMLANSEFIVMLNQASTDRLELAKLLNISDTQLSYITNVDAGHGLIKVGSSLVPFANKFPKNTKLYKLMTTKPGEGA